MNPLYPLLIGIAIGIFIGSKIFSRKFENVEEAVKWINGKGFHVTLVQRFKNER